MHGEDSINEAVETDLQAAWALFRSGHDRDALVAADALLETAPENASAWLLRCAAFRTLQRWQDVLATAAQVERFAPDDRMTLGAAVFCKGDALDWLRRYPEALIAYRRAIILLPTEEVSLRASAWLGVSRCLWRLNQGAEALVAVQRAVEIDPTQAEAWFRLAESYRARHQMREALEALEHTLALDADHPYAGSVRAWVLLRLGRLHESWCAFGQVRANFSAISLRLDEHLFGRASVDEPPR